LDIKQVLKCNKIDYYIVDGDENAPNNIINNFLGKGGGYA